MTIIENVDHFNQDKIAALVEGHQIGVLYFYGSIDPGTKKSWCPDCAEVDSAIRVWLSHEDVKLIDVPVGDRESWKINKKSNFYRNHSYIKVDSVPTLVKIDGAGKELSRLSESELKGCSETGVSGFI